jgi:carbonic anhydrase/acetyltransferase-like protein (isoleucine patch superfamily)
MRRVGDAFVAAGATVVGDVRLGRDANVWYGAVVRGDDAPLTIGDRTNLQDGVVMHADTDVRNDIAEDVTVGHGAILHGTRVERYALIAMGSVLLGRSVIGEGSIVAAGCVVPEGMVVPPWSLVVGARPRREDARPREAPRERDRDRARLRPQGDRPRDRALEAPLT